MFRKGKTLPMPGAFLTCTPTVEQCIIHSGFFCSCFHLTKEGLFEVKHFLSQEASSTSFLKFKGEGKKEQQQQEEKQTSFSDFLVLWCTCRGCVHERNKRNSITQSPINHTKTPSR